MDKYVLGISAFYHDSAAALIKNNEIIAAAQEERFTRKKHDPNFPINAINYCLEEAFIDPQDLDLICFYDHPFLTLDRVIKNSMMVGNDSLDIFKKSMQSILSKKIWVSDILKQELNTLGKEGNVLFTGHHASHAASAFYPSPYKDAAIITVDGVGEWSTTTIGFGKDNAFEIIKEINYPHSLGLLYSAFTYYCGFKINSGEYKLMGLAPYGKPEYADIILDKLIDVKEDGSFCLNMDYLGYMTSDFTTNENFNNLFGGKERTPESRITKREMNLAASIQKVTEYVMLKMAVYTQKLTGSKNLCMAGGVALNCVANGKLFKEKVFENIWIQPASGDAGGSLGSALIGSYLHYGIDRPSPKSGEIDLQKGTYLGPKFSNNEIEAYLNSYKYPYIKHQVKEEKYAFLGNALKDGKIIGFLNGRMEFGPRSLGARSIIGDSRNKDMQSKMNLKIKFRESFRPFAPAVLAEDVTEYFDYDSISPYMLQVAPINKDLIRGDKYDALEQLNDDMIGIINKERSTIPAVTHVDYSARIQTIHKNTNEEFYNVVSKFKELTGCSVVVNTSFNVRSEPIVCTPKDAYVCFMRTDIDILVLEDCILLKQDQPKFEETENWRENYELD